MPYTDPQSVNNPTAGQPLPAAWGDLVRDDLEWVARNKPHARVFHSVNQSIPNTALTVVLFNSERVDVGAMHSTVTNTGRLTIPAGGDGWYDVGANVRWAVGANATRILGLRVNGATYIARVQMYPGAADSCEQIITCKWQFVAGDYVELLGYQGSGGALNIEFAASYSPEFWCTWESA